MTDDHRNILERTMRNTLVAMQSGIGEALESNGYPSRDDAMASPSLDADAPNYKRVEWIEMYMEWLGLASPADYRRIIEEFLS